MLSEDENIIKMIDASESNLPALSVCVKDIEHYIAEQKSPSLDLSDTFTRTAIGRMIKTILLPFGYEILARSAQQNLSTRIGAKYFTSASRYAKTGKERMTVKRTIVAA